ncbi:unnamed protein product [Phytophthora lilii]|uniref:Unnamed protein product n=1 Tax=Phytophthora lilii TaxID=2077276 RepID=A0A9W6WP90_9STRA|nr:unnamed protein product [Phytophthora lilii]
MIEASLEEEVHLCEKNFNDSYRKVVNTLRDSPYSPEINAGSIDDHEEKISSMMETAGASACPDEMLRIEVSEGFRKIFIEFHEDLKLYEREFIVAASATDAAGTVEAAKSKTGGWDNLDEERFVKVLHSYERKHGTGKKPQLLYDTLALVLPNVSLVEIKKHVKFHQHLRFHLEKKKDRQREFQRRLEDLHSEAIEKFRGTIELEKEKTHKLQQLNALQHHCDQLHDQVSQWRVTKEAKERIEQQQREIEQMLGQQKQQEETLRKQRKLDQQKLIVAEYKYVQ